MIRRDVYMNQLHRLRDKNIIKVVTGIRRCGKSTLLHMFQKELAEHGIEKERMIAVNLESGDFRKIRTADDLYDYVEQRLCADKTNYVFLDEVQNVPDFQRAVDWLYAKPGVDLYLRLKCLSAVGGACNPAVRASHGNKNAASFFC